MPLAAMFTHKNIHIFCGPFKALVELGAVDGREETGLCRRVSGLDVNYPCELSQLKGQSNDSCGSATVHERHRAEKKRRPGTTRLNGHSTV